MSLMPLSLNSPRSHIVSVPAATFHLARGSVDLSSHPSLHPFFLMCTAAECPRDFSSFTRGAQEPADTHTHTKNT